MFRVVKILLQILTVAAVLYLAGQVPVGGTPLWRHVADGIKDRDVARFGRGLQEGVQRDLAQGAEAAREAADGARLQADRATREIREDVGKAANRVADEVREKAQNIETAPGPVGAPKPEPVHESISDSDRRQLDNLIRQRTTQSDGATR